MPFCAQCGSETQGEACPACGTRVEAAPAASQAPASSLDDHIVSALCYLLWPLTGVLFLVLEPYNRNRAIRFHAFQSILVFGTLFAGFGGLSVLAFLPIVGLLASLAMLLYPVFGVGVWLFLAFKAYNKERFTVPVLGALAASQA
jgi:uncharacterized membrane protein